jgi:hypothetical protein
MLKICHHLLFQDEKNQIVTTNVWLTQVIDDVLLTCPMRHLLAAVNVQINVKST